MSDGKTALHLASERNSKEIIEVLLSYGANFDENDNVGKTSLHFPKVLPKQRSLFE